MEGALVYSVVEENVIVKAPACHLLKPPRPSDPLWEVMGLGRRSMALVYFTGKESLMDLVYIEGEGDITHLQGLPG